MSLHITDTETEKLAAEIAEMTGDTKAGAVREALREKKKRLERRTGPKERPRSMQEWLEREVWPLIPEEERGKPLTKEEVEDMLGFGPGGSPLAVRRGGRAGDRSTDPLRDGDGCDRTFRR
jgi:antitoxin VapB